MSLHRIALSFVCCAMLLVSANATAKPVDTPIPRIVYTLYDSTLEKVPFVHRIAEMPLNWLGYHMEFVDSNAPLPAWRDDVAGVIIWLPSGVIMPDQPAYADWLQAGITRKKKLLFMGANGFDSDWAATTQGMQAIRDIFNYIGMRYTNKWVQLTYHTKLIDRDPSMVDFEYKYTSVLPSYQSMEAKGAGTQIYLTAKDVDALGNPITSHLITTHSNGGYIADEYGFFYVDPEEDTGDIKQQRWIVDPFAFFSTIFTSDYHPAPDVTTLNGNRIYYSHMDGDGWNNMTEISRYHRKQTISAEVLLQDIFLDYANLPFTVAPIVAELDTECQGLKQSAQIAREIFMLPNIEPSSHTHSHPLYWEFFDDYHPHDELPFLPRYSTRDSKITSVYEALGNLGKKGAAASSAWQDVLHTHDSTATSAKSDHAKQYYDTPRSYGCAPFDMTREIAGSVDYISKLAPDEKPIRLIQWSGDTRPSESALAVTSHNNLININGGDSRYDNEYPSYSYVSPIGYKLGDERQIYSSNSNENTYTDLWRKRFFGFRYLVNTVKNTESPRRVSPFNIYFHSYSGEKTASLRALRQNLNYALSQEITPVFTSNYVDIANGFYSTNIVPIDDNIWRITNRGALQTLRFDNATLRTVDWSASSGIIGQQHYQGSLYIFLNPTVDAPVIALKATDDIRYPQRAPRPYLLKSHGVVDAFALKDQTLTMAIHGFGRDVVQIYWPYSQKVALRLHDGKKILRDEILPVNSEGVIRSRVQLDGVTRLVMQLQPAP